MTTVLPALPRSLAHVTVPAEVAQRGAVCSLVEKSRPSCMCGLALPDPKLAAPPSRNLPKRPDTCSFEVGDTMQVSANALPLIASARVKTSGLRISLPQLKRPAAQLLKLCGSVGCWLGRGGGEGAGLYALGSCGWSVLSEPPTALFAMPLMSVNCWPNVFHWPIA